MNKMNNKGEATLYEMRHFIYCYAFLNRMPLSDSVYGCERDTIIRLIRQHSRKFRQTECLNYVNTRKYFN